MTDGDLLRDAVAELYSSDPDEFIERRGALIARAREAGQAPAAKQIAALRKPTRSAWVVNRLVRADPGATAELASLGGELRAAQGSLDGAAIRELSQRRRELIESLARRAFTVAGQHQPPAGLRDEVTATLGAALADPQFADTLAAGTLVRAVQAEGFGPVGRPALTLVKGAGRGTTRAPRAKQAPPARGRPVGRGGAGGAGAPPPGGGRRGRSGGGRGRPGRRRGHGGRARAGGHGAAAGGGARRCAAGPGRCQGPGEAGEVQAALRAAGG